jgi:hypothetical protein
MTNLDRIEALERELKTHRESLQHVNDAISGLLDVARKLVAMVEQAAAEKRPEPPAPAAVTKKTVVN